MQDGRPPSTPPSAAASYANALPPRSPAAPALPAKGGRRRPPPPQPPRRRPNRQAGEEVDEDDAIHATVSLPPIAATSRHAAGRRGPGLAVRSTAAAPCEGGGVGQSSVPVPPPRPESTISPWTRDIVRTSSPLPSGDALPDVAERILPAALESPSSPCISLTTPRPGIDRSQNLYVDAPLKKDQRQSLHHHTRRRHAPIAEIGSTQLPHQSKIPPASPKSDLHLHPRLLSPPRESGTSSVITSLSRADDGTSTLKKSPELSKTDLSDLPSLSLSGVSSDGSGLEDDRDASDSIICNRCGRCRCAACRAPRRLPERWLCGDKCHLSASAVVDGLSCMWIVRAAMYHFGKDVEESDKTKDPFDNPCSCSADHACARWTCLAATSVALPCLCCYAPMRCCVRGMDQCYANMSSNGCRCEQQEEQSQGGGRRVQPDFSSASSSLSFSEVKCNNNSSSVVVDEPQSISSSVASSPLGPARKGDSEKLLLG